MTSKLKAKQPSEVKPGHLKAVIFGESGAGKTYLSLMFPACYYCDTEGGARLAHYQERLKESGGVYFGPDEGAGDFVTLLEEIRILSTEKHDYRTLVIDSVSKPYNTAIGKEADRITQKGDKDAFGISKKPAIAAIRSLIHALDKLDMNVFLICHEKPVWSGGEQTGYQEDCWEKLRYELDLTLRLVKQAGKRYAIVAKSRLTGFPDGDRFEATYEEIIKRYGKDYITAPAEPVAMATPEQVAEINKLLETLKVDEKEIDKWHVRAKADSFSEYRAADLQKLIEHLKAKVK